MNPAIEHFIVRLVFVADMRRALIGYKTRAFLSRNAQMAEKKKQFSLPHLSVLDAPLTQIVNNKLE